MRSPSHSPGSWNQTASLIFALNKRNCPAPASDLKKSMRFLRQNQYLLVFVGVLILSSVLVIRQFMANQSAHIDRREDFILLHDRDEKKACAWLYQRLIQELPAL